MVKVKFPLKFICHILLLNLSTSNIFLIYDYLKRRHSSILFIKKDKCYIYLCSNHCLVLYICTSNILILVLFFFFFEKKNWFEKVRSLFFSWSTFKRYFLYWIILLMIFKKCVFDFKNIKVFSKPLTSKLSHSPQLSFCLGFYLKMPYHLWRIII